MASNISHSLIITPCELKLSSESESKFLFCFIVLMSMAFDNGYI